MGRIMGIDYGLKRTGIAVTDPNKLIVNGLETQDTIHVLDFIISYGGKEQMEKIVVGYPFMEGAWGSRPFKEKLDQFIADLRKAFPFIEVVLHDERYTSIQAREIISKSGHKKSKRQDKGYLDRTSAILILQEYLGHI